MIKKEQSGWLSKPPRISSSGHSKGRVAEIDKKENDPEQSTFP